MPLPNIKDLGYINLLNWLKAEGENPIHAKHLFQSLYKKNADDFNAMPTIPKALQVKLQQHFSISRLKRHQQLESVDGSIKYIFELEDGNRVEAVLMPHAEHYAVCVSSQVGCAMGCDFCMTAKMGLIRNLSSGEILDQLLEMGKDTKGLGIRNVVFMGMGEPFHNYSNVMTALHTMQHHLGFNLSARRISISTSGLVPQIIQFSKESIKANLAISLNGVTDEVRSQLMPINKAFDLEKLISSCRSFPLEARKRITFEYILIQGLTDSVEDAQRLIQLLRGVSIKVNLIPYNNSPNSAYKRPTESSIQNFRKTLMDQGLLATLRISKGQDIQGACGQLVLEKT